MIKHRFLHRLLLALALVFLSVSGFAAKKDGIYLSQLGFRPEEPKFFVSKEKADTFQIIRNDDQSVVLQGKVEGPIADSATGRDYWRGDFSAVKKIGEYTLVIGKDKIGPIRIVNDVWSSAQRSVIRSYYLQRCGAKLKDAETKISHGACHLDDGTIRYEDAFHKEDEEVAMTGGWHDAGDYGKYISPAGISISVMLMAQELYPQSVAGEDIGIPESGNGVPDLLDELRWELEWMLKMQRPDGGVYHKIGGHAWPGDPLPEDDPMTPRFVYAVSTSATAKFSATMAYAARIYKPFDTAFADRMLKASELAWQFVSTAPFCPDPIGSDNSGSGQYGDSSTKDDKFWAAIELFITTKKAAYEKYALANIPATCENPGWIDGSALAMYHYAAEYKNDAAKTMRNAIVTRAKQLVQKSATSAFGITLAKGEFEWASNKTLMGWSMILTLAHRIDPNPDFQRVAAVQLHYIFGQNPMDISYVTGVGEKYVRFPHQRLHWSTGHLPPGQLSGGPNDRGESGVEPKGLGALSYIDDSKSYSCNEYAIDYNANLFFVLVAVGSNR